MSAFWFSMMKPSLLGVSGAGSGVAPQLVAIHSVLSARVCRAQQIQQSRAETGPWCLFASRHCGPG